VEYTCELDTLECSSFFSSREMQTAAIAHGGHCRQSKEVESIRIGRCTATTLNAPDNDNAVGRCASVEELCDEENNESFESKSDSCTVSKDSGTNADTRYGSCVSHGECVWSANDCDSIDDFAGFDQDCTCDRVQVGGCVKDELVFCAVSEMACDELSTWIPAMELLLTEGIDTECYLCRDRSHNTISDEATLGNDVSTSNDVDKNDGSKMQVTRNDDDDDFSTVFFVVALFCVLGLVALITLIVIRLSRKRRSKEVVTFPKELELDIGAVISPEVEDEELSMG